jgi:hypothetical protein
MNQPTMECGDKNTKKKFSRDSNPYGCEDCFMFFADLPGNELLTKLTNKTFCMKNEKNKITKRIS